MNEERRTLTMDEAFELWQKSDKTFKFGEFCERLIERDGCNIIMEEPNFNKLPDWK